METGNYNYNYSVCKQDLSVDEIGKGGFGGMNLFYAITQGMVHGLRKDMSKELLEKIMDTIMGRQSNSAGDLVNNAISEQSGAIAMIVIGCLLIAFAILYGGVCFCLRCCCGWANPPSKRASVVKAYLLAVFISISIIFIFTSIITLNNGFRHFHNSLVESADQAEQMADDLKNFATKGVSEFTCYADQSINITMNSMSKFLTEVSEDIFNEILNNTGLNYLMQYNVTDDEKAVSGVQASCTVTMLGRVGIATQCAFLMNILPMMCSEPFNQAFQSLSAIRSLQNELKKTDALMHKKLVELQKGFASAAEQLSHHIRKIQDSISEQTSVIENTDKKVQDIHNDLIDSGSYSSIKGLIISMATIPLIFAMFFGIITVIGLVMWICETKKSKRKGKSQTSEDDGTSTTAALASNSATAVQTTKSSKKTKRAPGGKDSKTDASEKTERTNKTDKTDKTDRTEKSSKSKKKKNKKEKRKLAKFSFKNKRTYPPCSGRIAACGFYTNSFCSVLLMIFAMLFFLAGFFVSSICVPLFNDPEFKIIEDIYTHLYNNSYDLSIVNRTIREIKPSEIFKSCKADQSLTDTIHLGEQIGIDGVRHLLNMTNINTVLSDQNISHWANFELSNKPMITNLSQSSKPPQFSFAISKLDDQLVKNCTNDTARQNLRLKLASLDIRLRILHRKMSDIGQRFSSLSPSQMVSINSSVFYSKFEQSILAMLTHISKDALHCGGFYQTYENVGNVLCGRIGRPVHGIWGGVGLGAVMMIILAILLLCASSVLYSPTSDSANEGDGNAVLGTSSSTNIGATDGKTGTTAALASTVASTKSAKKKKTGENSKKK